MFDRIKRNLPILIVIVIGIITITSFSLFYDKQKKFSERQKEFLLALDKLEIDAHELRFAVLQNYIYAYNNNDTISTKLNDIEKDFDKLIKTDILAQPRYIALQENTGYLKNEIDRTFRNVQRYLMYNTAIKNSLLFLSGLEEKYIHTLNLEIQQQSSRTLQALFFAKRISDISYLNKDYKLKNDPKYPEELQRYIRLFNLHTTYIVNNLPLLLKLKKSVEENRIIELIDTIKEKFIRFALKDTELLNRFTLTLLFIFISIFIYLITLLIRYRKEHRKLEKTTKSLQYSLTHDILTGLKNRIAFEKEKPTLSNPLVILVNIDRFKDINDVFGTEVGDALLRKLAALIKESAKEYEGYIDAYRISGDEFCLLFEHTNIHKASLIAEKMEKIISGTTFNIKENELSLNVTLAINNEPPLLEKADLALKAIKRNHTQKIVVYDHTLGLHRQAKKNIDTIKMVKKALAEDRVLPYFQPIVNLESGKVEKFEALVRIVDDKKIISPYAFLGIIRKTHLYFDITHVMLEKTFQVATQYPEYRFSINLSIADISNEKFVESLFALFQKHILVAGRIDIELLETEELYDIQKVKHFIERVHSFGSLILIDDFGSGYSNFAYFADFEIDIIKIDGSIIREIATNSRKHHMLKSIVMFAENMNLKIIAEFVDNPNIVPLLQELDIQYAQGYLFSPPQAEPVTTLKDFEIN